jgi:TonB family protein
MRVRIALPVVLLVVSCASCAASGPPAPGVPEQGAVLLRTYYVALRPGARIGSSGPPLGRFVHAGQIPGGQDGRSQLAALAERFTLPDLGFQFSDATGIEPGGAATLSMGFGQEISIHVRRLVRLGKEELTAEFEFRFGEREIHRSTLSFPEGDALLFAGQLDAGLPILSVFSLEVRLFPASDETAVAAFLGRSRQDRKDFAPPPPVQRGAEPYIPGIGGVTMPALISSQRAVYPEAAKPLKLDGQVIVEVVVDREGKATNPKVLTSSHPYFDPPAFEAAKTYRYEPALKDGKPVAVTMNLVMIFRYSARGER